MSERKQKYSNEALSYAGDRLAKILSKPELALELPNAKDSSMISCKELDGIYAQSIDLIRERIMGLFVSCVAKIFDAAHAKSTDRADLYIREGLRQLEAKICLKGRNLHTLDWFVESKEWVAKLNLRQVGLVPSQTCSLASADRQLGCERKETLERLFELTEQARDSFAAKGLSVLEAEDWIRWNLHEVGEDGKVVYVTDRAINSMKSMNMPIIRGAFSSHLSENLAEYPQEEDGAAVRRVLYQALIKTPAWSKKVG